VILALDLLCGECEGSKQEALAHAEFDGVPVMAFDWNGVI